MRTAVLRDAATGVVVARMASVEGVEGVACVE